MRVTTTFACVAFAGLTLGACAPKAEDGVAPAPVVEAAPPASVDAGPVDGGPVDGGLGDAAAGTELTSLPTLTKAAEAGSVLVTAPTVGARVTSPLTIEGTAINTFFFEGVFPVELVVNGKVVAQAPAQQSGDRNWTEAGQVGFKTSLEFEVTKETEAELVFAEDMPERMAGTDVAGPARAAKIPVVLVPSAQ